MIQICTILLLSFYVLQWGYRCYHTDAVNVCSGMCGNSMQSSITYRAGMHGWSKDDQMQSCKLVSDPSLCWSILDNNMNSWLNTWHVDRTWVTISCSGAYSNILIAGGVLFINDIEDSHISTMTLKILVLSVTFRILSSFITLLIMTFSIPTVGRFFKNLCSCSWSGLVWYGMVWYGGH